MRVPPTRRTAVAIRLLQHTVRSTELRNLRALRHTSSRDDTGCGRGRLNLHRIRHEVSHRQRGSDTLGRRANVKVVVRGDGYGTRAPTRPEHVVGAFAEIGVVDGWRVEDYEGTGDGGGQGRGGCGGGEADG